MTRESLQIDICGDDGMGYIALGDLISKAQVEKCGKREYPVLSMTMHDGIVFQNDRFKKDIASIDRSNYSVVGFNQLVVSFPIDEGVLAVQDITDAGIVSPAYKIWDIDQAKLMPKYLEMWLRSPRSIDYYKSKLRGTTARRRSIPEEDFLGMSVNVPPKEEQKRIVDLITRVNGVILLREQELAALDDLIKARFVEMFGEPDTNPMRWPEKLLSEMLNVLGGYAFKSDGFSETNGIPVLRIGNINAGFYKPVNMVFWEEDERLERYIMHPGDLVMSLTGTVGKDDYGNVCILGSDYPKYYLNQRNAKLELKEGLEKHYLSQLLRFDNIKKRLTGISRGVRQANISNKDILSLRVPIPPLELQQQFAAFVAQIEKSKSVIQKSLDETQLLFDSLMQKYFG